MSLANVVFNFWVECRMKNQVFGDSIILEEASFLSGQNYQPLFYKNKLRLAD